MSEFPGAPREMPETNQSTEDLFFALVDTLDAETRKATKFKKILADAEDSGDYENGLKHLQQFKTLRDRTLDKVTIKEADGHELPPDAIKNMMDQIQFAMSVPEKFLGNGATAEVFTLRRHPDVLNELICAKVIRDYSRYAEGLSTTSEMSVLASVRNLIVEGVRSPVPLFAFSSMRLNGFVMEHLDAVNFRRILEGQTTEGFKDELPERFDLDEYFGRLRAYVKELHGQGIMHNDLHLRNMMIDRRTGLPRVIDFGKAVLERDLDKSKTSLEEEAKRDLATLHFAEKEAQDWLAGKA